MQEQNPNSSLSKNIAAVGHLWFFWLSHRLRIEWNLPIRLASMSSWILVIWWNLAVRFPASLFVTIGHHAVGGEGGTLHSNPQIYILGGRAWKKWPFSTLVTDSCLSHSNESVTRVKNSHVFVTHVNNSNEFFTGMTNTCEFFTHLKLDICEKLVPIKISKLVVRIFHTYQNVTYSCEYDTACEKYEV